MSYQDKMTQIISVIEQYNETSGSDAKKVDLAEFTRKLKQAGATSEDTLRAATFEDFEDAGLPKIIARRAAEIARATEKGEQQFVSSKRAERMTLRELVDAYNPNEAIDGPVTTRLKTLTKGIACVVFNQDGTINRDATHQLVDEAVKGFGARSVIVIDDVPYTPMSFGRRPAEVVDENPAFPGEPLRPDGTCMRTDVNWTNISHENRQLVRLLVLENPQRKTHGTVFDMHDLAERGQLKKRYPKIAAALQLAMQTDTAPSLKIRLGASNSAPNDPFHGARA